MKRAIKRSPYNGVHAMRKRESDALIRAKKCIDQTVKQWNCTTLSDLEKYCREWWLVEGEFRMALYFFNTDDYFKLKQYILDEYGFKV